MFYITWKKISLSIEDLTWFKQYLVLFIMVKLWIMVFRYKDLFERERRGAKGNIKSVLSPYCYFLWEIVKLSVARNPNISILLSVQTNIGLTYCCPNPCAYLFGPNKYQTPILPLGGFKLLSALILSVVALTNKNCGLKSCSTELMSQDNTTAT